MYWIVNISFFIELYFIVFYFIVFYCIVFIGKFYYFLNVFPTLIDWSPGERCVVLVVLGSELYWQEEVGGGGDSGVCGEWRGWREATSPPHLPPPQPASDIRVICCTVNIISIISQISDIRYCRYYNNILLLVLLLLLLLLLPPEIERWRNIGVVCEHSALGEYFIVYFSWK